MCSILGFIISFTISVFIEINSEQIDLIASFNNSVKAKGILNYQQTWEIRKSNWYLNLTDDSARKLAVAKIQTNAIVQALIKNKDFELCAILHQDADNFGSIFSITNKQSVRLLEIRISLQKNLIRIIYSPDEIFRGYVADKIEYVSTKSLWHSICFEYKSHNKLLSVIIDCAGKIHKQLRYRLPHSKLSEASIDGVKIWVGQRNSGQSYFKGIIKQMVFSTDLHLSSTYCEQILQNAISVSPSSLSHFDSILTRLDTITNEFMDLKMRLLESENRAKSSNKCQCFPTCTASNGDSKAYDEAWQENPCRNCRCTLKGTLCHEEKCPNLTCSPTITEPNKCCQRCGYDCLYRGKTYSHMSDVNVNCLRCNCKDGKMTCRRINPKLECPKLTCNKYQQVKVPGKCCKKCKERNICEFSNCGPNSFCVSSSTSFACQCKPGFQVNQYRICEDINECRNSLICPESTECINTIGSFVCICKTGYIKLDPSSNKCQAVCEKNKCKNNSTCIAPEKCECKAGYAGDQCDIDIDECALGLVKCPDNSECLNIPGSYICRCVNGYEKSRTGALSVYYNHQCKDINECIGKRGSDHLCSANSACVNTNGGYSCMALSNRNDCEIVNLNNELSIVDNGKLFIHLKSCMNCQCFNGNFYCFSITCNCSDNYPKTCCRKCSPDNYNSSLTEYAINGWFHELNSELINSSCPNILCPKVMCTDAIFIPGQCCKLCYSELITSCLINYNYESNIFNSQASSCFLSEKIYANGDRFILKTHADGSCMKCLCWNQYICCAKSFKCRS